MCAEYEIGRPNQNNRTAKPPGNDRRPGAKRGFQPRRGPAHVLCVPGPISLRPLAVIVRRKRRFRGKNRVSCPENEFDVRTTCSAEPVN